MLSRLIHHRHSGKLVPHARTSYPALAFMLFLTGVLLSGMSVSALAATPAVNPQSGSLGLEGAVRGPAPSIPAVILFPRGNSIIDASPITVTGTCSPNTFVSIYKNSIFGGFTPCADDGTFSLLVDLFFGTNHLVARISDALGQVGPDSPTVTVTYTPSSISQTNVAPGSQLFLRSDELYLGTSPHQNLSRRVTIAGGKGPYAVSWDFGDGNTQSVPVSVEGETKITHSYDRSGTYRVIVRVTDITGNTSVLELVTVVNGPVSISGATKNTNIPGYLLGSWPLYLVAVLMVVAFWTGERRELFQVRKRYRLTPNIS